MDKRIARCGALILALALLGMPQSSAALAPALLVLVKQIAQQAATSMLEDALLASLDGMGCKGMALSNALAAYNLRNAGRGGAGAMLGGMPNPIASIPPEMAAQLQAMLPSGAGALPPGLALDPEQMEMMAKMQQMLGQPLSPPETLATIDALFELGFLPKAIQSELKECMVLVPAAIPALGMGMGMLQPMIPRLRQARDELHALPSADQDEVAAALVQQLKSLPANEQASLSAHLDSGFFPARVSQGVKAALGVK